MVVDCHDPERLAAFWCAVLGFKVIDRSEGNVEIGSWEPTVEEVRARQTPPTLLFVRVPEGKTVKNRLHLDVYPIDGGTDAYRSPHSCHAASSAGIGVLPACARTA